MKCFNLISLILLMSCSVQKEISESEKISNFINVQNYTVKIPSRWHSVSDHNFVSYTPKSLGDVFYKNTVRIFNITPKEKTTLKKVSADKIIILIGRIKINSQKIIKNKTQFGTTYTHHYKHSWNYTNYEVITHYFKVNDNYYSFTYSSDIKFQKKYLYGANCIFNSFKIRL